MHITNVYPIESDLYTLPKLHVGCRTIPNGQAMQRTAHGVAPWFPISKRNMAKGGSAGSKVPKIDRLKKYNAMFNYWWQ